MSDTHTADSAPRHWGLLPDEVKARVLQKYWQNTRTLKGLLTGKKPFPLRISLKPPRGKAALADMGHLQTYVKQWRDYPYQPLVQWEAKTFRDLDEQRLPVAVVIPTVKALIQFIGDSAINKSRLWERNMGPVLALNKGLYPALVKHLDTIEKLSLYDAQLVAKTLPQLQKGMGQGHYLRSLPLKGVDTKFVETHSQLLADLLDTLHSNEVTRAGGLRQWLDCAALPKDWLTIRPLDPLSQKALGNLPLLQLTGETLKNSPLPAKNILVVENLQSGLGLPALKTSIAVCGGGRNVAWMDADWLQEKRVGYWGDIDSWGLTFLSDAKARCAHCETLMMDEATLERHKQRVVTEPVPTTSMPEHLNEAEKKLFNQLTGCRLEQERLCADFIQQSLYQWLSDEPEVCV